MQTLVPIVLTDYTGNGFSIVRLSVITVTDGAANCNQQEKSTALP